MVIDTYYDPIQGGNSVLTQKLIITINKNIFYDKNIYLYYYNKCMVFGEN